MCRHGSWSHLDLKFVPQSSAARGGPQAKEKEKIEEEEGLGDESMEGGTEESYSGELQRGPVLARTRFPDWLVIAR